MLRAQAVEPQQYSRIPLAPCVFHGADSEKHHPGQRIHGARLENALGQGAGGSELPFCSGLQLEWLGKSIMMNGSELGSPTGSSPKSKEDQVVNGHDEKENNPFAEYMWMENEEDFNRQVEEELQEQEFLDRCFQEMLEEEDQDWFIPSRDLPQGMGQLQQQLNGLSVCDGHSSEDILSKSNLNPDAKEFVPGVKY
ncbi:polyadenylate-binding protein-interacting protein 2B isoform 2-T2 [Ara ararauna]